MDLIAFSLIPGNSISCNKDLVGLSVVLTSVLQWTKLCADFLLNYSFSEEMQGLQEIADLSCTWLMSSEIVLSSDFQTDCSKQMMFQDKFS